MPERFYPRLSSIVTIEDLPEQLSFINTGLSAVFNKLYFRDLQYTKSEAGDTAFYSLSVLSPVDLSFTIPGLGISLVLNRAVGASGFMEIPFTLSYEWKILKVIRGFKLENFSFESGQFFDTIAKAVLDMTGSDLLKLLFSTFFEDATPASAMGQFVTAINSHYGVGAIASNNPNFELALLETIGSVVLETGKDPFSVVYEVFLEDPFGDDELSKENLNKLFVSVFGMEPIAYIKDLLIPKVEASLQLKAEVVFPRNMLTPLDGSGNPLGPTFFSAIQFAEGTFAFSTVTGIGFDAEVAASLNHPSQIGNTGLTIDFTEAKLDISRTKNIPEANLDGRPNDFVGVFIRDLTIGLPPFIKPDAMNPNPPTVKIVGKNMLIGTGGISGTVGLQTTGPGLCKTFGDKLQACFTSFDMTFKQNAIVESNIAGTLTIPGFKDSGGIQDAVIDIRVHFGEDGDFSVTASEAQGIDVIKIPGIFSVELKSVEVGRKDDRFYIAVSGAIDFEDMGAPIGNFLPDKFDITRLVIWEDGKIEFEGGKITLPKAISLSVGPVTLSVTAIGLGSHEQEHAGVLRQYKYFSFDGGIDTGPGGVDVSGSGIAFYYTTDGGPFHFFMRIQSIAIDITIPGDAKPADASLLLKGFLAMKSPENGGGGTEYVGGVDFSLPKLKMGGSAAMRMNPKIPAFLVDVGLELSSPIVLGSTGLGIYGFRGLVGQRYVATKNAAGVAPDAPWWQYYKAKVPDTYREGIVTDKFEQTNGFSLGAGVSVATVPDAGKTFSSKLFFLLSLPEVFLLQGQGQVLKERIGLDTTTDPPFFAMLAISSTSIEAAFGVNYKVPDDGSKPGAIADVNGLIEMGFFWGNSAAWYINLGKDQPEDRRISVRLLTLFNAYFYMMLSSNGIRAGAGASYDLKKKFGPLKAHLYAYLDVAGKLSFKPKQIGASIAIGGGVELSIFGFGFSLSAEASLAAEAPKPFIVSGSVKACIRVLRKKRCAKFSFTWTFDNTLDLSEIKLITENPTDAAKAINIQTRESYDLYAGTSVPTPAQLTNFYVPADSFIDLEFVKGMLPSTQVISKYGGNTQGSEFIDFVAPQRGKSDRVRHEYEIESIKIKYHDGSSWKDYDVYGAITPLSMAPFVTTNLTTLPFGYWQYQTPNLHNKLRILAQSPIEYVSQGSGDLVLEDSNITLESIFCPPDPLPKCCTRFDQLNPGYGLDNGEPALPDGELFFHGKALMHIERGDGIVTARPWQGYDKAICFKEDASLFMDLVEPMACVNVRLFTANTTAVVVFYERQTLSQVDASGQPLFNYVAVQTNTLAANSGGTITYDDQNLPIERVEIRSGKCQTGGGGYYYYYGGGSNPGSKTVNDSTKDPIKAGDTEEKLVFRSEAKTAQIPNPGYTPPTQVVKKDCDLLPEGDQLVIFLNTIIDRGQLNNPGFSIWPGDQGGYNNVFYNTVLYGPPPVKNSIRGSSFPTNTAWTVNTIVPNEWDCQIVVETQYASKQTANAIGPNPSGTFWDLLVRLENPRCDPDDNTVGPKMTFLVEGIFLNPVTGLTYSAPLKVTSCYEVCKCEETCGVFVYEYCTQPYQDVAYNGTLPTFPQVQNEIQTMINSFEGSLRPIWRFDTPFHIEVKTKDTLYREAGQSVLQNYNRTYYFGFRTAGPIGHFHKYLNPGGGTATRTDFADLLAKDQEDEFKLSKLLYYIDMSKSYPNADGQLINAKPLFFKAPQLAMFYNQQYVYEFFHDWDDHNGTQTPLEIELIAEIKDPAPDPAVAALSPTAASWSLNSLPVISQDVLILNNMIVNSTSPCTPSATINPMAVNSEFALPDLEPLKLYTSIFNCKYRRSGGNFITREIHRYGFQTSRYGNFKEQVQSYVLESSKPVPGSIEAVFEVEKAFDNATQILVAKDILDPSDPMPKSDILRQQYGHPFNRLIEGALKLESLNPPVSTEFNVIRDKNTTNIIGILVKNPEPFNDPKIDIGQISTTIRMSVNGSSTADYSGLFSKDYSQVFLTNANQAMNLPDGANLVFTFEYKVYNGATYVVQTTETVSIQLS